MIKAAIERIVIGGRIWIDGYLRMQDQGTSITTLVPPAGMVHIYPKAGKLYWRDDADVEHEIAEV